jgi:hypothetical protein
MRAVIGDINDVVFVKEMDELAVSFREVVLGVIEAWVEKPNPIKLE